MMTPDPSFQMWLTLAIIIGAVVLYAWEKVPMELVSLGTVAVLLLLFHFAPLKGPGPVITSKSLLAGFADPALISILALLVIGQGIVQTGAIELPVRYLVSHAGNRPGIIIGLCLVSVTVTSAFINDTPVVVIFIPIMSALAEQLGRMPSRVMIPLSFAAILGGMTTLIGSSTNLLVAGTYERLAHVRMDFFDITPVGAVLAAAGLVYVLFLLPRILPDRRSLVDSFSASGGKQFIVQIDVKKGSILEGKEAVAGMFPDLTNMTVRAIERGSQIFVPPFEDVVLQSGDSIVAATTRKHLMEAFSTNPKILEGVLEEEREDMTTEEEVKKAGDRILAEVVVAPASRMDGWTLEQTGFRQASGCAVMGIQRRSRMMRKALRDIRLEAGDVLLLLGKRPNVRNLRNNKDVLLLEWSTEDLPERKHAAIAGAVFLTVIGLAASGMVPIPIAALTGATAMIALGCLNIRQASRAINRRIFLLIGAALAMGTSLQYTGGATYLAEALVSSLTQASPAVMLSAFFLLVTVMTNILSNNATAVLFTPIAVEVAQEIGVDPTPFVMAVIFAANCSFATPMGYQTNLLVMGPGHYRFADFMRGGIPLIFILWLTFSLYAPWYFGF